MASNRAALPVRERAYASFTSAMAALAICSPASGPSLLERHPLVSSTTHRQRIHAHEGHRALAIVQHHRGRSFMRGLHGRGNDTLAQLGVTTCLKEHDHYLEFGRNVADASDAWCYLRESYVRSAAGRIGFALDADATVSFVRVIKR